MSSVTAIRDFECVFYIPKCLLYLCKVRSRAHERLYQLCRVESYDIVLCQEVEVVVVVVDTAPLLQSCDTTQK